MTVRKQNLVRLADSLQAWQSDSFNARLKAEIENLASGTLPLENGTTQGGYVDDNDISVTVINTKDPGSFIQADIGVFFGEIIAGCSCGDEPFTVNAYCEIRVTIDKENAQTGFRVISP